MVLIKVEGLMMSACIDLKKLAAITIFTLWKAERFLDDSPVRAVSCFLRFSSLLRSNHYNIHSWLTIR